MINIFTKELFGITHLYYKEIDNAVVNIYCIFKDKPKLFIFFIINNYISFTEIKNLLQTYLA